MTLGDPVLCAGVDAGQCIAVGHSNSLSVIDPVTQTVRTLAHNVRLIKRVQLYHNWLFAHGKFEAQFLDARSGRVVFEERMNHHATARADFAESCIDFDSTQRMYTVFLEN